MISVTRGDSGISLNLKPINAKGQIIDNIVSATMKISLNNGAQREVVLERTSDSVYKLQYIFTADDLSTFGILLCRISIVLPNDVRLTMRDYIRIRIINDK